MDYNSKFEERIEIGKSPHNLVLELRRPYGALGFGSRYRIVKSPFRSESGSGEISVRNFRLASETWEEAVRSYPNSVGIAKACARDVDDITYLGRLWRDISSQELDASGYGRSVERYFEKAKIDVKVLRPNSLWQIASTGNSDHPLNQIAKELDSLGVGVQLCTSSKEGFFHPFYNVLGISVKSMLQEGYESLVGTLYHETIHGVLANLSESCKKLNPFRARQDNRQTGLEDPYRENLFLEEIISHSAGGLFGSLAPEAGNLERDLSSVKLMNTIIDDCTFTQHVLSQYDFIKTSFDNGNNCSCSANISLKREYDPKTRIDEPKAVLMLGGVTTYALPKDLIGDVGVQLKGNNQLSLIDLHKNHRPLARRVLEEIKAQVQTHYSSAKSAREFLLAVQGKPEVSSKGSLINLIDERIKHLSQIPGIQEIENQAFKVLDLCKDYYFRLLSEQ